jgi:hypothetical protein
VTHSPIDKTSPWADDDNSFADNPFAVGGAVALAPVVKDKSTEDEAQVGPMEPPRLSWVISRWTLVCVISAVPSFLWGLSTLAYQQWLAMILGVATFVVGYVWLDVHTAKWDLRQNSRWMSVVRIGYWTRIVCSLVLPVGMFLDLWCGMLSYGVAESIWNVARSVFGGGGFGVQEGQQQSFLFCYFMTLLQGVTLNVFLAGYMLVIAGFIAIGRSLQRLNTPRDNG